MWGKVSFSTPIFPPHFSESGAMGPLLERGQGGWWTFCTAPCWRPCQVWPENTLSSYQMMFKWPFYVLIQGLGLNRVARCYMWYQDWKCFFSITMKRPDQQKKISMIREVIKKLGKSGQADFYFIVKRLKMHFLCIFIAFLTAPRQLKPRISWSVSRSLQRNFWWSKNIFW